MISKNNIYFHKLLTVLHRSSHTLAILMSMLRVCLEYGWSMARVWLEYGWSMARVWQKAKVKGQKSEV